MTALWEIESPEQMRRALKKKDPELQRELQRALDKTVDGAWASATYEWEVMTEPEEWSNLVDDDQLIEALGDDADILAVLEPVPAEYVQAALRREVLEAGEANIEWSKGRLRSRERRLLAFASGQGPGLQLRPVNTEIQFSLDDPVPTSDAQWSWVPKKRLLALLKRVGPHGADWEVDDDRVYSGWFESGDYWRLEVESGNAYEWAVDLRDRYFSELVDAAPEVAVAALLKVLRADYPALAKKIKKAKLPQDVLADYAVAYFSDPEHGIELISEAVGQFGYEGTRGKVLLTIDEDVLKKLGITTGRWWDGAPWKLIDLPVEELAYEGTLMRHCVGRHGMGYREAVERGETQVWSLRSRYDKPVLTFEVDAHEWEAASTSPVRGVPSFSAMADARARRGAAIEQLKGKLNRPSGQDPEEAAVLNWIFTHLDVSAGHVRDFRGVVWGRRLYNPPTGFDRPWRPYVERVRARLARW